MWKAGFRCRQCGKTFELAASLASDKTRSFAFCSRQCYTMARDNYKLGAMIRCEICCNDFYVTASRVRQWARLGRAIRFCSMKCRAAGYIGNGNPMWGKKQKPETVARWLVHPNRPKFSSGRANPNYKRWEYSPFKRKATESVRHSMRVIVRACERCNWSKEVSILEIHHKDRNRTNNTRSNLELLCPNCHMLEHFLSKDGAWKSSKKPRKPRPIITE